MSRALHTSAGRVLGCYLLRNPAFSARVRGLSTSAGLLSGAKEYKDVGAFSPLRIISSEQSV